MTINIQEKITVTKNYLSFKCNHDRYVSRDVRSRPRDKYKKEFPSEYSGGLPFLCV